MKLQDTSHPVRIWDADADAPELANVALGQVDIAIGEQIWEFPSAEHAWQITKFINPDGSMNETQSEIVTYLLGIEDPVEVKEEARLQSQYYIPQYDKDDAGHYTSTLPLRRMIEIISFKARELGAENLEKYRNSFIYESPGINATQNPGSWGMILFEDDETGEATAEGANFIGRIWMRRILRMVV
ncbi:MAG: hypothetical protein QY314_00635 [Candidatus Dojkabacteria bacterium]|nr:MAG: hypothetical protein QY314_00635 [Candidatus Dojkabacteria bacterium]